MMNVWDILSLFNDVTTILLTLVILLVVGYVISMRERSGIPPGPPFWPIVGNMLDMRGKFAGKRHKYYAELQAKYGDIFRIYFGDQLLIVLNDFESIEEAFVKQKDLFSTRPVEKLWVLKEVRKRGDGLIWASGQEWKDTRRMAIRSLRDLGVGKSTLEERIKEETNIVLDYLSQSEGKPIKVHEIMMKATTNIISTVVFGKRYDYSDPEFVQIIKILEGAFTDMTLFTPVHRFPVLRFIPFIASKMLAGRNASLAVEQLFANRIEKRKKLFDKYDIKDFIDVYLDMCDVSSDSSTISDGNTRRAIMDLYFAGSDTTATTLDWAFLFMVLHPEVQKKCQEEIDSVVGASRMVDWSDRSKMPYNEATLLEVQRLGNAVPMSLPHTTDKDTIVKGYLIPEGTLVFANLYACHHDSRYWKEPLQFKPERFVDDLGKVFKPPAALIPFSIGPRICAGEPLAKMELFLFFTNLLQRFSFSTSGSEKPSTDGVCGVSMATPEYTIQATPR